MKKKKLLFSFLILISSNILCYQFLPENQEPLVKRAPPPERTIPIKIHLQTPLRLSGNYQEMKVMASQGEILFPKVWVSSNDIETSDRPSTIYIPTNHLDYLGNINLSEVYSLLPIAKKEKISKEYYEYLF